MRSPSAHTGDTTSSASRRALGAVFAVVFLDVFAFALVIPLLPVWAQRFTASPYAIISLSSVYALAQFAFAPAWGALSDRVGRRRLLALSIAGEGASLIGMALGSGLGWLYAARVAQGIFAAGTFAIPPALVADVTTPERRSRGMGFIGAALALGFVLGPGTGAQLAKISTALPFFAAAAVSAVNLLVAILLLPETHSVSVKESTSRESALSPVMALARKGLPTLMALFAVNTFAFSNMESSFTLFLQAQFGLAEQETVVLSGRLLAFVGVVAAVVQGGLIGPLTARFGEKVLLAAGFAATSVGLATVPGQHSTAALLMPLALAAAGFGLIGPSLISLISRAAGPEHQGAVQGLTQGLGSVSRTLGPQAAAVSFGALGIGWPFWTAAALLAACFAVTAAAVCGPAGTASARPGPAVERRKDPA